MALSLQQLVDMIRQRGASADAKRVNDAFVSLDTQVLRGFGQDFGALPISLVLDQTVTVRSLLLQVAADLRAKRSNFAQQAAIDRAIALLEKEDV
jgi:hypothetical protein